MSAPDSTRRTRIAWSVYVVSMLGVIAVGALAIYALYLFALIKLIPITLTLAGIAAFILSVVLCWNEYFFAALLTSTDAKTLPVMVASQTGSQGVSWWSMAALSFAAILPLILIGVLLMFLLTVLATLGGVVLVIEDVQIQRPGMQVAAALEKQPGVVIKYVCDVDSKRADQGKAQLEKSGDQRPLAVTDFRKILDDREVDALFCEAPNHWHGPATILGCDAGKHVYSEKPLAARCNHWCESRVAP